MPAWHASGAKTKTTMRNIITGAVLFFFCVGACHAFFLTLDTDPTTTADQWDLLRTAAMVACIFGVRVLSRPN